ncbi:MAG: NAD-dependent epimerase/dehydratase family protein [Bradyrhizobium sp.]|uniref:NAD-dependent epimerase/dehydratase family protein n=1 Tax=Bradyrhizobium sp. TaxID=376 RepID=UPI001D642E59|nr:NAD-dependent epimerase/dehydratase family protein [Bradyrhizobium sp.]MBV9560111.1 NAD-dependent epimerase/dehydratase family protein [Bradyrhizobium sp.]
MRVLVLGGTGVIGSAIVSELVARGHSVIGLARSEASARTLASAGATPLAGDIGLPEAWIRRLPHIEAVIHAACDFSTEMAAVDGGLLDVLLPALASQPTRVRLIYTGGCWLYGPTGNDIADEETPFDPLPAFAWMVSHLTRVLKAREIEGVVIHPAMVYATDGGGVFTRFARDARDGRPIRIVADEAIRWPLVRADDLARLYALALERAASGSSYIGAAIDGVPVGAIVRAFARRFGTGEPKLDIVSEAAIAAELGAWARGYARDQLLSDAKARRELGWKPQHLDPVGEILALHA